MAPHLLFPEDQVANMMKTVRMLLSCTAVLILVVSVAGCGSSNPAAPSSSPGPTPGPPATSTLGGLLTDGFSGGILPGIDVRIMSGPNQGQTVKTDSTGHYSFAGIARGTFSVEFSAVSYATQTLTVT